MRHVLLKQDSFTAGDSISMNSSDSVTRIRTMTNQLVAIFKITTMLKSRLSHVVTFTVQLSLNFDFSNYIEIELNLTANEKSNVNSIISNCHVYLKILLLSLNRPSSIFANVGL